MSVTYDWSPLLQAIQGFGKQYQYNKMLDSMGSQLPGATPAVPGMPAIPGSVNLPSQPQQAPVVNSQAGLQSPALAQDGMKVDASLPALPGQPGTPSPMLGMLQAAGPEYGIPMLLNTMQRQQERQYAREDKQMTPMTADEVTQRGFRPGTVAYKDAFGGVHVEQQSDLKSPEAIQQAVGMHQQEQLLTPEALAQKIEMERVSQAPTWASLNETKRHNRAAESAAANPFGTSIPNGADGMPATGDVFLGGLSKTNPGLANQVKAIATYRQAPPGRGTKQGIALLNLVNQYAPTYDATQFDAKHKARNDFTTGKNGNNVRSLNVAVQHLEQLGGLSGALGNGDVQMFNKMRQSLAQQTGTAAPTNFDGVKQLVGDEIVKAVVGSGGGVHDREEIANTISRASSPQQLAGIIKQYQGLLGGQLRGLKKQYEKSTGLGDFESFLDPLTITKLQGEGGSADGAAGWSIKLKGQ